jgi:myo-inositol-1(or 4)-monophosphatase
LSAGSESTSPLDADWLGACRRAIEGVKAVLAAHPETADRAETTGRGEGGDLALVIDRGAEDVILAEIEALGVGVTVISEERGRVELHGGGPVHVVVDPIDGSLNAKRRLPLYGVSIAVASGPHMGDVELAYVYDLGRDEEWWARRGGGAFAGGEPLAALGGERPFEILGLDGANPRLVAACAEQVAASGARRLRAIGSIALSLAYVAGARFDAMISLADCRSVDAAAGQLLVRELGGAVTFPDAGGDPAAVSLSLDMRSRVLAAANEEILARLLSAMPDESPGRRRS